LLLFCGVFYTAFYYGFVFFAEDVLDDGIYKEVDMSEAGSATDINFTVKKAGIYEISFIYAQDPQKQKEEEKLSEEVFPGYGSDEFTKWFCRKTTAAKLAGYYGYTTQGVPEPMGTSEEEKAACTGEKILLKVMLKSLQNRKINYVKGGEANELKQNLSALTESFDLSKYGATSWYSAPNGGFAHDKVLLRAELEKGEYNAKVQALSDAPELKKIVTFIKISRYHNWK